MLVNALFLSAILTVLTALLGNVALLAARESSNAETGMLLEMGARHGIAAFERAVAAGVSLDPRSGDFVLPQFAPGQELATQPLIAGAFRIGDTLVVAGAQTSAPGGPDIAAASQRADKLDERRVSVRIRTVVYPRETQRAVGEATAVVTFRLFGQRPFVEVAGAASTLAADPAHLGSTSHEGDSGGNVFPINGEHVLSADTGLHLTFKCFGNVNDCQFSHPPVDRGYGGNGLTNVHWTTNNENDTHWSY